MNAAAHDGCTALHHASSSSDNPKIVEVIRKQGSLLNPAPILQLLHSQCEANIAGVAEGRCQDFCYGQRWRNGVALRLQKWPQQECQSTMQLPISSDSIQERFVLSLVFD